MEELAKAFEPKSIEEKWSQYWELNQCFTADPTSSKPPYSIVMPPPNVTGVLHMGHALVNTLQDALVRFKRMSGFEVLWVPGTDHAGIATQTVVERQLIAQTGKRRKDFSREEFLSYVWEWKEKSQEVILGQLRKLGCSCDWTRLCFTMDPLRNQAVKTAFKKLFDDGLIYRGDYLVNWDPVTQTALADDEVEYEEKDSFLWHFRYPLQEKGSFIVVATTRPETLLGDTAVAVSPEDKRYQHLIGKEVILPLCHRAIPVIADRHVDPAFGSGAVKVTPAHDPNDYEMGLSHNLPFLNIMTPDGKIEAEIGTPFAGLSMEEARHAVVHEMEKLGLLEKVEPYKKRIGISYRSKAVIEPYLSKQWFVRTSSFKRKLREVVEQKEVQLVPENWESTYFHWIDHLRDWCISRQLWWGHRIPIWYSKNNPEQMICHVEEGLPAEVEKNPEEWVQEEDVLDTWFSSALWPFSTLGWPEETKELEKFYPTSILITGHDILFFWVARMIMMGTYFMDKVPFPETFLHGLIYGKSYWKRQKEGGMQFIIGEERLSYDLGSPVPEGVECKWEKMSKSKGNVIDPIEMIDLYGTDAVRMALCASATQARQIDLDRRKFEEFKNFANKVWNGARFVFMNLEDMTEDCFVKGLDETALALEDQWILSSLNRTIQEVYTYFSQDQFDKAAMVSYDFFWKEFCAYYVEMSKPVLFGKVGTPSQRENKQKLLAILLLSCIRLLHPMTPFITEELFMLLKGRLGGRLTTLSADPYTQEAKEALRVKSCSLAPYPKVFRPQDIKEEIEKTFAFLDEIIRVIRNIRAEMQLPPSTATDVFIVGGEQEEQKKLIQEHRAILESLVKIKALKFLPEYPCKRMFSAQKKVGVLEIVIPLPEELKEKEKLRLEKEREKTLKQLTSLNQRLQDEEFLQKAPIEILQKLQNQRDLLKQQHEDIENKLSSF